MNGYTCLKSDLKQIRREPILVLFACLSLLLIIVFKLLVLTLFPVIKEYTGFELMSYYPYVVTMVYLLQPLMLGTVMGFFMLDEKDAHIFELLRVTPLGLSGYLKNRLLLPVVMTGMYNFLGWVVLGRSLHGVKQLLWIIGFTCLQTIAIGIFIAMVSDDKVKGLTNAKAVSVVTIFGLLDLFQQPIVAKIGLLTPQYYVSLAINNKGYDVMIIGLVVHIVWVLLILKWSIRRMGE